MSELPEFTAPPFSPTDCPMLVVKIGSSLLVAKDGAVRRDWLTSIIADIAYRVAAGQKIIIVASGSIALGAKRLGFEKGGRANLADAQASASIVRASCNSRCGWRDARRCAIPTCRRPR